MNKLSFSISEASTLLDMPVDTIRYYDKIGIVKPQKNPINNYREYNIVDLCELEYIKLLRELDFSINDIKNLASKDLAYQNKLLKDHHKLILDKIEFFKKLELRFRSFVHQSQTIDEKLNVFELISHKDRYFKILGKISYAGNDICKDFKENLLKMVKENGILINRLCILTTKEEILNFSDEDVIMTAYFELNDPSNADLILNGGNYVKFSTKVNDSDFKDISLKVFDDLNSKNINAQGPMIISFLDTFLFYLENDESLIEYEIAYS